MDVRMTIARVASYFTKALSYGLFGKRYLLYLEICFADNSQRDYLGVLAVGE
jgi:hypothetical protein